MGIELDPRSLSLTRQRLAHYGERFIGVGGNYANANALARTNGIDRVDGFLLDLGFSSRQVETPGYGFSFQRDEPLDMRYDPNGQELTAYHIVNHYQESELTRLFREYGEEPQARRMARAIERERPINTTGELAALAARAARPGRNRRVNPATRVFQALRIAVNGELDNLARGLTAAVELLRPGGRLAVISYHSLEDRLVKNTLAAWRQRASAPGTARVRMQASAGAEDCEPQNHPANRRGSRGKPPQPQRPDARGPTAVNTVVNTWDGAPVKPYRQAPGRNRR